MRTSLLEFWIILSGSFLYQKCTLFSDFRENGRNRIGHFRDEEGSWECIEGRVVVVVAGAIAAPAAVVAVRA